MSYKVILPPANIGIIGGGQLGRMLAMSARQMGYGIIVLDPKPKCPASQLADQHILADFNDLEAINQLYQLSDVITYEFENIPSESIKSIVDKCPQTDFPLYFTQDRFIEKTLIREAGFPTVNFQIVSNQLEYEKALEVVGTPALLKTRKGGYDGKGQILIQSKDQHVDIDMPSIIEAYIPLKSEASLIVTRSIHHEIESFPVIDNIHQSQRLIESNVPSKLSDQMTHQMKHIGHSLVQRLNIIGTLTIEFFITQDDKVLINECAPRVHNSGHLTIEACHVSQFEQHIRAICGLPLKMTTVRSPSIMFNIYGQHMSTFRHILKKDRSIHFHDYGKKEMKINRKVGHITICLSSTDDIETMRTEFHRRLNEEQ
jgi:5-(carboxyamino)imidazole ribonucleotide synthase